MKKFGRTIWIGVLAGLAFLGACATHKGLTKSERAQLVKREGASVYGSPEIIQAFGAETQRVRHQLDSINNILGENEPK